MAAGFNEWSAWFEVEVEAARRRVVVVMAFRTDGTVARFELRAVDDGALTAPMLRAIPFGALATAARGWRTENVHWVTDGVSEDLVAEAGSGEPVPPGFHEQVIERVREARERLSNPRRAGRGDRYYAALAVAYENWVPTGRPLETLAEDLGPGLPLTTLRSQLREARERGLLEPKEPGRGRKRGWATDRAKQLLEDNDDDID
jgi:hypothetical protein